MLFLKVWVQSIQALPNPIKCFPNYGFLFLITPNMCGKSKKNIHNPRKHILGLILNLPIHSSPRFLKKNNKFHKWTFSNLVFGDEFASNETIGMYYDFFHVLETKFQSKEVKMILYNEFPFEIQCNLSSVHKGWALNFNLQVESILIHIYHELHDITEFFSKFQVVSFFSEWMIFMASCLFSFPISLWCRWLTLFIHVIQLFATFLFKVTLWRIDHVILSLHVVTTS